VVPSSLARLPCGITLNRTAFKRAGVRLYPVLKRRDGPRRKHNASPTAVITMMVNRTAAAVALGADTLTHKCQRGQRQIGPIARPRARPTTMFLPRRNARFGLPDVIAEIVFAALAAR
jgi:hypothetical protein